MFTPRNDMQRRCVHGFITDNDAPMGPLQFEAIDGRGLIWCTDEAGEWWATRKHWERDDAPDNEQLANLHFARATPPAGWTTTWRGRRDPHQHLRGTGF